MASTARTPLFSFRPPQAAAPTTPARLPLAVTRPRLRTIVLSWDDVLFPTSWMADCVGLQVKTANKNTIAAAQLRCLHNPFIVQALTAIEQQAMDLLETSSRIASVYIVSSYNAALVDAICSCFFPRLRAHIAKAHGKIQVVSPPTETSPQQAAVWKLSVYQQIHGACVPATSNSCMAVVTADEVDIRNITRLQTLIAQPPGIQTMALAPAAVNGKARPLVDFHKQMQGVSHTLAQQL